MNIYVGKKPQIKIEEKLSLHKKKTCCYPRLIPMFMHKLIAIFGTKFSHLSSHFHARNEQLVVVGNNMLS